MIGSIEGFVAAIREGAKAWPSQQPSWFRGEPGCETPLLPTLYRRESPYHENPAYENQLLQAFRARAPAFHDAVPDRDRTDQWLFLARHAGLHSRLLDWSEGALLGLHFALKEKTPIVWMLNPLQMNYLSGIPLPGQSANDVREFPLPWHPLPLPPGNPAFENVRGAWEYDAPGASLPVAVHPTYVHSRLRAQRACFTIHGREKAGISQLIPPEMLKRYEIDPGSRDLIRRELRLLGITESVAFPDLDGLAKELIDQFS